MLDRELVEAVKVAREAGAILLDIYATDFAVDFKGDKDPVTEADRRVNALLVSRIRETFPADGIVAEEGGSQPGRDPSRVWYIDPLDGTKEFIAKNGEFSVMIGLAVEGEARLGVVFQPTTGKLYRGVVGDGAFYEVGDKTWLLKVTDTSDTSKLRLVVSRSHRPESTGTLMEKLGITSDRPPAARSASRWGSSPSAAPISTCTCRTRRARGTPARPTRSCAPRAATSPICRAGPSATIPPPP
jgi:3'(2'), 5'-bisphosphate nucleotidase